MRMEHLHEQFVEELKKYTIKNEFAAPILYEFISAVDEQIKTKEERIQALKSTIAEVSKKIESIEEKYFALNEMGKEVFERFYGRYNEERGKIQEQLGDCLHRSSNMETAIQKAIAMATQLPEIWRDVPVKAKEIFQRLLFPEGIFYNKGNGRVLTNK